MPADESKDAIGSALQGTAAATPDPLAPVARAIFRSLGVDGVYARTALFEDVLERLGARISREREPGTEVLRFPPIMSREQLEKSGYLKSFPNLLGCVCALHGTEASIRAAAERSDTDADWTSALSASDLVLTPAACYPLYPLLAGRGRMPRAGLVFDVAADCFRHEPDAHLDRLQAFRMREFVRIGSAEAVTLFREQWMERAQRVIRELELPFSTDAASDPFFGRIGQVMAVSQLQQALKFELLVPLHVTMRPTACMSFNYHRDHFGLAWGIEDDRGDPAHTGCVAFGMDRLAVALFCTHGLDLGAWPPGVRRALAY